MWPEIYYWTCLELLSRWFPLNPAQWDQRYHCWIFDRDMSWSWHWTLLTACDWWKACTVISEQRRWSPPRHCSRGFLGTWSATAFFDVRVFNPFAPSYHNTSLTQCYRRNELEKRRAYDERIREVEHGSFSPLVFSVAGGMGATAKVVYKRIASLIADKHNKPYSKTMNWLRCRLSFSLLRSAVMCLRGSRSSLHHPISSFHGEIDLAIAEGQGSF